MSRRRPALVLAVTALALSGCGQSASSSPSHGRAHTAAHHHATKPPVCNPRARDAMAHLLSVAPARVAAAKSINAHNSMPQCTFTAPTAGHSRVRVIANIDSAPSPYDVLERTVEEDSQIFGPRVTPAPVQVSGLGITASWFPGDDFLKTTDGLKLFTATVTWHGARRQQEIVLARAVLRPYLRHLSRREVAKIVGNGSIP